MVVAYDENVPAVVHNTQINTDNSEAKNYMDMRVCAPVLGVGSTGTMFRLQFLGSVEVEAEGGKKRKKRMKKNMVEEAVIKIKVRTLNNQCYFFKFFPTFYLLPI